MLIVVQISCKQNIYEMTEIPIYYNDTNHTPITLNKVLLAVVYTMEQIIIYLLSCIHIYTMYIVY